ncbi:MAG: hypothetical protein M2R45_02680 [Verrucomicrobia subdivision 3 bacterium]|nr:hypothetical protein [Limisphaerales bacterium]MCS1414056.1 hypothetical protein [Limisphaerales bacterium]
MWDGSDLEVEAQEKSWGLRVTDCRRATTGSRVLVFEEIAIIKANPISGAGRVGGVPSRTNNDGERL